MPTVEDVRDLYSPAEHSRGDVPEHAHRYPFHVVASSPDRPTLAACRTVEEAQRVAADLATR